MYDLHSDPSGNIYAGGSLDGVADFDLTTGISGNAMTNGYDTWIAKYNSAFELQWFRVAGDQNNPVGWDKIRGITTDADGSVYASGEFTWTTDFDPANPGNFTLTSAINSQVPSAFLCKIFPNGTLAWVKKIGNSNDGAAQNYASVSVVNLNIQNQNLVASLEGEGNWDMDPSNNTAILSVGATASPGIGFGQYTLQGDLLAAFSIDTALSGAGITTVGAQLLQNGAFVCAGRFNKLMDFNPLSETHVLAIDPNGPFASFDNDLYAAKYSFGNPVGMAETKASEPLQVFPNPTHYSTQIQIPRGTSIKSIQVFNSAGQCMYAKENPSGTIATDAWTPGIYWIQVFLNDGSLRHTKLMRE